MAGTAVDPTTAKKCGSSIYILVVQASNAVSLNLNLNLSRRKVRLGTSKLKKVVCIQT